MNYNELKEWAESLKIRCHALSNIMSECKDTITDRQLQQIKALEDKETLTTKQKSELTRLKKKRDNPPKFDLSEGAKSYVKNLVKERALLYTDKVQTNALMKGIMCEPDAIDLYNLVYFKRYRKHEGRKENEYISGECDVWVVGDRIIDFKCSESKKTFPLMPSDIKTGGYEWQGRGYMWLYDEDLFELCFALVDTPDELLEYENNLSLHHCEDVPETLRLTSAFFKRDKTKEPLIAHKVKECRKYALHLIEQLNKKNA